VKNAFLTSISRRFDGFVHDSRLDLKGVAIRIPYFSLLIFQHGCASKGHVMPVELLIGAAVGAGLASKSVRKTIRKGVVYSLAGVLVAYDKVAGRVVKPGAAKSETTGPNAAETPCEKATNGAAAAPSSSSPTNAEPAAAH
jgi:hypothetical protein